MKFNVELNVVLNVKPAPHTNSTLKEVKTTNGVLNVKLASYESSTFKKHETKTNIEPNVELIESLASFSYELNIQKQTKGMTTQKKMLSLVLCLMSSQLHAGI
jgi:hypothetical protein